MRMSPVHSEYFDLATIFEIVVGLPQKEISNYYSKIHV